MCISYEMYLITSKQQDKANKLRSELAGKRKLTTIISES